MREIRPTDSYVNYHYFICIEKADAYQGGIGFFIL